MLIVALYLGAIVAANLLVAAFGPPISIVNAFLFIGLDITSRDRLHAAWRGRQLFPKMALLIATGSVISYALNASAGAIALASFVAFSTSATADTMTYAALGDYADAIKINGSNLVAATLDSILFPLLAFGLPLLWPIVIGQLAAKVIGGLIWSYVLPPITKEQA
jgi:hypothetical protein